MTAARGSSGGESLEEKMGKKVLISAWQREAATDRKAVI